MKVNVIIDATIKKINNSDETIELATPRYDICKECPSALTTSYFKLITDNTFPLIQGKRCDECGCSISLKIRSKDKCPINKW